MIAQARAELGKTPAAGAPATAPLARVERTPATAAIEAVAPAAIEPVAPAAIEPVAPAAIEPVAPAAIEPVAPAAIEPVAPDGATFAPTLDPAERVAALFAAARAETERLHRRQRQFYVWAPVAVMAVAGLWTLVWMWLKL
ncbi:MAG: hypothetical protein A3F75_12340 [Betaproteobacteria bacterium RIFCSPLOWO2_12_FULL_64_23]|nr:MAG: hypothetical protein A3F75_12340 [Betaproteobacteria bacterium RIFCSPLOWO2_12_FULL_64_23]